MEILEKISEYLNDLVEYLKELAVNVGNKISEISANIKQKNQQKRNNSRSFQSNPYMGEPNGNQLSFNLNDGVKSIGQSYREIRFALSPIGSKVLVLIPFYFLYLYASENIRINEKLIIFLVVAFAAFLNAFCTGIEFAPVIALMFFSTWEINAIVAAFIVLFLFFALFRTESEKRGRYVYPLIIMIITGFMSDSGVFFVLGIIFMCSLFWYNSTFPMLSPLLIIINAMIAGMSMYLPTINELSSKLRVKLFNVPITEYLHTVAGNKEFMVRAFENFLGYMKIYYPIFIAIFIGLYILIKIFRTIVKISKIDRGSLKYIIIAHLYAVIALWAVIQLAHFVYSCHYVVVVKMVAEQRLRLLDSFDNLKALIPVVTAHMKTIKFMRLTVGDFVTAFLLSIPISVFVKGYEK